MENRVMRTDSAIEWLHEFDSKRSSAKRKRILEKQNAGFNFVVFESDVYNFSDAFYTKISRYKK